MKNNIDLIAAKTAQTIIKTTKDIKIKAEPIKATDAENLITKALGVLQENGVYAALLYLYTRTSDTDKIVAEKVREQLLDMTSQLAISPPPSKDVSVALTFLTERVCPHLDTLLLVKQTWEQTLIYARYGAKAWNVETK
ncbi:MAG TPA: hypothetical protein VGL94_11015 [Ktedonobacteraceae bacterium]|jgi:hypothetical protein